MFSGETGRLSLSHHCLLQLQTFRLQRVFDVKRDPLSKVEVTNFSFETDEGRRCLSVQLPGQPRLQPGDKVTAVLTQADNWQTLRGWKNLTTGEPLVRGQAGFLGLLRLAATSALAIALWCNASTDSGRALSGVFLVLCGLMAVLLAQQQWQTWQVRKLLARQP